MPTIAECVPANVSALIWPDLDRRIDRIGTGNPRAAGTPGLAGTSARAVSSVAVASKAEAIEAVGTEVVAVEPVVSAPTDSEPAALEIAAPAPVAAFSAAEHRDVGVGLLKKSGTRNATGLDLTVAGQHFFQAYLSLEDARLQGSDIAHCGICLWQAALEFFRCGALAHLARTRSGAPEELLLTTALRPLDFPGGMLGSSLRRALEPRQIGQLVRCVELAVLCFRRAAEFGESDLAAYWQAIVFRGIGGFSECRELAKDALLDRPGSALAGVVNAIGAYLVDFQELRNISAVAGATQNGWVQPLVLDSVAPLCELLDGDPFLSRTKSRHMATLGGVEGIILASRATTLEPPHRSQTLLPFTARTGSVACRVLGGPTS